MPDYVALLRAINVGGRNSLPMEKLRNVLAEQGASSVATYIQSGNVVFSHSRRGAAKLTAQLASAITAAAGFEVPVMLRTRAEWTAAIANNPYGEADVHCAFLPAAPSKTALAKVDPETVRALEVHARRPRALPVLAVGHRPLEAGRRDLPCTPRCHGPQLADGGQTRRDAGRSRVSPRNGSRTKFVTTAGAGALVA